MEIRLGIRNTRLDVENARVEIGSTALEKPRGLLQTNFFVHLVRN